MVLAEVDYEMVRSAIYEFSSLDGGIQAANRVDLDGRQCHSWGPDGCSQQTQSEMRREKNKHNLPKTTLYCFWCVFSKPINIPSIVRLHLFFSFLFVVIIIKYKENLSGPESGKRSFVSATSFYRHWWRMASNFHRVGGVQTLKVYAYCEE